MPRAMRHRNILGLRFAIDAHGFVYAPGTETDPNAWDIGRIEHVGTGEWVAAAHGVYRSEHTTQRDAIAALAKRAGIF